MTEMVKFSGGGTGLMSREDLARSLDKVAQVAPNVSGGQNWLKMDRGNGQWVYGQEETVVEDIALWAVNPHTLQYGWVAWDTNGGGAPVQEVMVSIMRDLPVVTSLPKLPMGTPDKKTGIAQQLEYQYQQSVDLTCISGEDEGEVCQYKHSSVGAMKLFKELTDAVFAQARKGDDIVPIVALKSEPYKHKTYGRIFNPIFDIKEWRTMDDGSPVETKAEEPKKAEEPAPTGRVRTRPTAASAQQQAPVEEPADDKEADEAAAAEYAAAQEQAPTEQAPRRRMRR